MSNKKELSTETIRENDNLKRLGWDDSWTARLAGLGPVQGGPARVVSVQRGSFLVSDGEREWPCAPSGRLRRAEAGAYPVTGDWVLASDGVVHGVIPRRNMLVRGAAGSRASRSGLPARGQAIAANIDRVFLVCGLDRDFNPRRLERYLALVYNCGLSPLIVLTKSDLHADPEPLALEAEAVAPGVEVVLCSSRDGRGRAELERYLGPGRTVAMLGSSGAGKSTLANTLHGSEVQATGAVSSAVGKGRHHTTARELIRMPGGGLLMDNPGLREIAFADEGAGVDAAFPDIDALATGCRFADCAHASEPGCAVVRAVRDGRLAPDRLESWRKMMREMEFLAARRERSADRVEKERWRDVALRIRDVNRRKRNR